MRGYRVFQTDDLDYVGVVNNEPVSPTCECENPQSHGEWTMWKCLICGKRVRGEARKRIKELMRR